MGTREDIEEGVGDGAVADRDDVNEERARDDDVELPGEPLDDSSSSPRPPGRWPSTRPENGRRPCQQNPPSY